MMSKGAGYYSNRGVSMWISSIGKIIPTSILYVVLNYVSYFLMFLNSLLLGKMADIQTFAVYGFILLFNQYLYYLNFGLSYSLGTLLAIKKRNGYFSKIILGNTLMLNAALTLLVVVVFLLFNVFISPLFVKYEIKDIAFLLLLNALIINANNILMQLYRIYTKYSIININQISTPFLIFLLILVKKESFAVNDILWAFLLATSFSILLYVFNMPIRPLFHANKKLMGILLKRGGNLLLYNMSFSFILVAGATVVSLCYQIEDFAQYKFAQNMSSATFMITSAFTFLFYPKILHGFSMNGFKKSMKVIKKYKDVYVGAFNIVSFAFCLIIPFVSTVFERFIPMLPSYILLVMAKIFTNHTGLYTILIVARKKEYLLSRNGFFAVGIVLLLCMIFYQLNIGFSSVAFAITIASLYYYLSIVRIIFVLSDRKESFWGLVKSDLEYKLLIPLFLLMLSLFFDDFKLLPILSFFVYCLLNVQTIWKMFLSIANLFKNEQVLDF